ncbi:MAG: lactate racemase domain-containing protein [Clostridiales bacterium]|nr:lactate racemase domain-containing protein [Clostridiales bacterium]
MPILLPEDFEYKLPKMHKVRQEVPSARLEDVAGAIRAEMAKDEILAKIKPGAKVAVGVGSRGLRNLSLIVKTVVDCIAEAGGKPFILSAMGSHGGGNEAGQRTVLSDYGVTEEAMGVPVVTKIDVDLIGKTKTRGVDVWFDKIALECDLIVPINRIKLHTHFTADIQSGLYKMLTIGFGNHVGCTAYHASDFTYFGTTIVEAADIIMQKANVGFGVAVVENAYDETYLIEAVTSEKMLEREKALLKIANENYPRIMVEDIDILMVKEIGKNISGTGMDPHVVGKSFNIDVFPLPVPNIDQMILLGATEKTHGNLFGVGNFTVITRNVFEQMNYEATYANCIAAKSFADAKIPVIAADEEEALRITVKALKSGADRDQLKIVKIKNTLELDEIEVSDALLPYVKAHPKLTLV